MIERILAEDSDVVCLQEFWVENEEMIALYQEKLGHRYQWNQLRRTGGRGDGLVFVYTYALSHEKFSINSILTLFQ